MKNKGLLFIFSSVALLLLIPFIAMQVSDEVNWSAFDFLVAAILLLSAGLSLNYIRKNIKKSSHRLVLVLAVLFVLLLVWLELAVGIFGTPLAGN